MDKRAPTADDAIALYRQLTPHLREVMLWLMRLYVQRNREPSARARIDSDIATIERALADGRVEHLSVPRMH